MSPKIKLLNGRHWLAIVGGLLVVISLAAFGFVRRAMTAPKIPTAEVRRGTFTDYLQLRGQMKALRSVLLSAPVRAGTDVQILSLVKNGAMVKPGDVVIQFDTTKLQQTLQQKTSEMKQDEAQIRQTQAQGKLKEEQDLTDVMKARFDVETAKLEVSKQEILSKIDGEERKLALADAEQRLKQAEQQLQSDQEDAAADVADNKQKRDKAAFEVKQAEANIAALTIKAPIGGLVTLLPNWRAGGVFATPPPFKQGDQAWPGANIAELPDLSTLRAEAHVDEVDRGRLKVGQSVTVHVDATPDKEYPGRVAEISTLAKLDFSNGWPPTNSFDLQTELPQIDPRLRPGMSATIRAAVEELPNSILIPTEAAFQKGGRTVAYLWNGSKFEERTIQVARQADGQVVVESGLKPGERVALKDPTAQP